MLKQWLRVFFPVVPLSKERVREITTRSVVWLKRQSLSGGAEGLRISDKQTAPYPEVTGYTIPTLIDIGEISLAKKYGEYLIGIQKSDGSFPGNDGWPYFFDTGQVLRGLLALDRIQTNIRLRQAIKAAVGYMLGSIDSNGGIGKGLTAPLIDQRINLYALGQLDNLPNWFGKRYRNRAQKKMKAAVICYKTKGLVDIGRLFSHFQAYIIDGFIECGESSHIKELAFKLLAKQWPNGFFPEKSRLPWMCTVGTAQFALIAFKLGRRKQGMKMIDNLCSWQAGSGGFYGGVGILPRYFPKEKISWANKFFIDALLRYEKELA